MPNDEAAGVAARGFAPGRAGGCQPQQGRVVAVVGAGFSGTMAAIHLRRDLPADHVVYLFDRTGRFARGPAYAQTDTPHLLNVRSVNMSALPDDSGHFERWLATQTSAWSAEVQVTDTGTFATRRLYGRYLRALLYQEMMLSGGRVRLFADEVTDLALTEAGWRLQCSSGREVTVEAVVIAAGNTPFVRPGNGVVHYDPWLQAATEGLRPGEPVLIVGTGLTMVDLALGMHARGFCGPIIALSRRGLVPQSHARQNAAWPLPPDMAASRMSLVTLTRRLRHEIRKAARQGVDWRAVIDALRPVTSTIWRQLPPEERSRFLRHLRPYWDIHRHRMAPGVAAACADLRERGVLVLKRGRVGKVETCNSPQGPVARVDIRDRGVACADMLTVQRIIYATGAPSAAAQGGLIAGLIASGLARVDRHGLGLDVTETLEVVDRDGRPVPHLWALGPLVRGIFWECTAVPDIRVQAREISAQIAGKILEKNR
jgi:uncharacterized NAD(P)/FAD-binding protein YdhS